MVGPPLRSNDVDALLSTAANSILRYTGDPDSVCAFGEPSRLTWYVPYPVRTPSARQSSIFGESALASYLGIDDLLRDIILASAVPHCSTCSLPGIRVSISELLARVNGEHGTLIISAPFPKAGPSLADYLDILERERILLDGFLQHREEISPAILNARVGALSGGVVFLSTPLSERDAVLREANHLRETGIRVIDLSVVGDGARTVRHMGRASPGFLCPQCAEEIPAVAFEQLRYDERPARSSASLWGVPFAEATTRPLSWWCESIAAVQTPLAARALSELRAAITAGFAHLPLAWDTRVACFEESVRLSLLRLVQGALADCEFVVEDTLGALPPGNRAKVDALLATLAERSLITTLGATEPRDTHCIERSIPNPACGAKLSVPYPAGPTYEGGTALLPSPGLTLLTGPSGSGKTSLLQAGFFPFGRSAVGRKTFATCGLVLLPECVGARYATLASEMELLAPLAEIFAGLPESRALGLTPGSFSLATGSHRCEACAGSGYEAPRTPVPTPPTLCPRCQGGRFTGAVTRVRLGAVSYAQLLSLPLHAALAHLRSHSRISDAIIALMQSGFGELPLGYPARCLTIAELHRLHCVRELAAALSARPSLILLDMPFLGASAFHRQSLAALLRRAAEAGHTVVVADSQPDPTLSVHTMLEFAPKVVRESRFELRTVF